MLKVEQMTTGKWIVTDGDVPKSGIQGTTKPKAKQIMKDIQEQRCFQKRSVKDLEKIIKTLPVKSDKRTNAIHALRAKRGRYKI
ncbi:MAG: hypothetical protein WC415_06055 [Patescibacteria group bacterium]|jgi:hypothetical protein